MFISCLPSMVVSRFSSYFLNVSQINFLTSGFLDLVLLYHVYKQIIFNWFLPEDLPGLVHFFPDVFLDLVLH